MTSVNPTTSSVPKAPPATTGPATASSGDGIVVNDHPVARNFLRWGGVAAGVAGVGALAMKFMSKNSVFSSSPSVLPLAVGGAIAGVAMLGLSFLGGLQPKVVPFMQSGIPSLDDAYKKASDFGDDVAIYKRADNNYALIDFSQHDFDNEDRSKLDLGNQDINWEALVTKDGDVLKQVNHGEFQDVGRLYPAAVKASDIKTAADVDKLVGIQVGTNDLHQAIKLGDRVGDANGYAKWADAAAAAYATQGATAIVQVADKNFLFKLDGASTGSIWTVATRGTGVSPVNVINVQNDKKIYRSGAPGNDFNFVGRATPFDVNEPLGHNVDGAGVRAVLGTYSNAQAASGAIAANVTLVDNVFLGRAPGAAVIRATNPDNTKTVAAYELGGSASKGAWDTQLGELTNWLDRTSRNWSEESHSWWNDENLATAYYTNYNRTSAMLHGEGGDRELRTTGNVVTGTGIDWAATNARRSYLYDINHPAPPPSSGGGTSPGDDPVGGGTSPGDDPVGGGTSPGDDPGGSTGGSTSPGDDSSSGGSSSSDNSSGYDNPSWDSGSTSSGDDSSSYGNPDFQ